MKHEKQGAAMIRCPMCETEIATPTEWAGNAALHARGPAFASVQCSRCAALIDVARDTTTAGDGVIYITDWHPPCMDLHRIESRRAAAAAEALRRWLQVASQMLDDLGPAIDEAEAAGTPLAAVEDLRRTARKLRDLLPRLVRL